jgi:hypothetical protein
MRSLSVTQTSLASKLRLPRARGGAREDAQGERREGGGSFLGGIGVNVSQGSPLEQHSPLATSH